MIDKNRMLATAEKYNIDISHCIDGLCRYAEILVDYNQKVNLHKRFHKFGFRKQTLHKQYGFPLEMTEREMTESLGYTRIWDCGLIKYVYRSLVM